MDIEAVGDRALLVYVGRLDAVHRLWRLLRANPPPGTEEIVAGAETVLVIMRGASDVSAAVASITSTPAAANETLKPNRFEIPVAYGGFDTGDVSAIGHLTSEDVARRHSDVEYKVAFLGFSPGFAYLAGGDPALRVPRLATPRTSVPAGSVALASEFTAVYPQSTPGGWRIIGRTDVSMFDPSCPEPALLSPGDLVRFQPVDEVGPPPGWRSPAQPSERDRYVRVLEAGPLATIQDDGRIGWAHVGVPHAGFADRRSARLANRLVGNDRSAPLLEATLSGPNLRMGCDRAVAVTGARAVVTVDGMPARLDTALQLRSGSELRIGRYDAGARIYVAFSGGIAMDPVLGSASTDTLSWLGPAPLQDGDHLALGDDHGARPVGPSGDHEPTPVPSPGEVITITARRGPGDKRVGEAGLEALGNSVFDVAATSDRTGVRLSGPLVSVDVRDELPSQGMLAGAVQLPPNGSPIVLLRNHPTTGGYPVAAIVTDDGVDRLAQCRPGVRIRFALQ